MSKFCILLIGLAILGIAVLHADVLAGTPTSVARSAGAANNARKIAAPERFLDRSLDQLHRAIGAPNAVQVEEHCCLFGGNPPVARVEVYDLAGRGALAFVSTLDGKHIAAVAFDRLNSSEHYRLSDFFPKAFRRERRFSACLSNDFFHEPKGQLTVQAFWMANGKKVLYARSRSDGAYAWPTGNGMVESLPMRDQDFDRLPLVQWGYMDSGVDLYNLQFGVPHPGSHFAMGSPRNPGCA
jgi:hypothetical protein